MGDQLSLENMAIPSIVSGSSVNGRLNNARMRQASSTLKARIFQATAFFLLSLNFRKICEVTEHIYSMLNGL